jgi:ASC-1-like (ASCH) protein
MDAVENFIKIQREGLNLYLKKNSDYGDSYKDYGLIGVLVRLGDKIKRLHNVTNKGINLVNDESLRDTLIDLQNYSTMAIMLYDEGINKKIKI